ncbi:MAG: V4R domain-containing protein [Candidatus Bathyarchaeia archaeon]
MRGYQSLVRQAAPQKCKNYFNPLDVGRIYFSEKGEKVYGLIVESVIRTGVLRELGEIAEKLGITVRYLQYSMPKAREDVTKGIAFLDFTNSKIQPEDALELLKTESFVKYAKLIKPVINGIVSDNYFFPLVISGERVVIFRQSVYEALFDGIKKEFGSAGEAMLYYQGFNVGLKIYDTYAKIASSEDVEKLSEVARAINMTLGWGIIEVEDINVKKGTADIIVYHNFECANVKKSGKPNSHFVRGAAAGIFTRFIGKVAKAEEICCLAKGDPYCKFRVKT